MGKLLIIKGANFSENALLKEKDFNILVAAKSVGYVILNATEYNPSNTPSEKGGMVVTLDNTRSATDTWFSFYPTDYVQELNYLNGAFSTWSGYINDKIKEIKIKANSLLTNVEYSFFAPIYSSNIIKRIQIEANRCPDTLGELAADFVKLKTPNIVTNIMPNDTASVETLDISGIEVDRQSVTGYNIGHPSKIIVNDCTQQTISNLIDSQTLLGDTYVQSTDAVGNTILTKQ